MKLLRATQGIQVFRLGKRETMLLRAVLRLYPLVPEAHRRLSKGASLNAEPSNQRLLDEALAEQRRENKAHLQAWLNDSKRFHETQSGCEVSLSLSDTEWLLQVFNDIRVGSWIALGAPEDSLERIELNESTAPHFWAMEMSGYFQMQLLEALEGGEAGDVKRET